MDKPFYNFNASSDFTWFEFDSRSNHKTIRKAIAYYQTDLNNTNQLVFGDLSSEGKIDFLTVSNNDDMVLVLSTVIQTLFLFFERYPEKSVIFTGSTTSRTRLYRGVIGKLFDEFTPYLDVKGFTQEGELKIFEPTGNYDAFLIRRKNEDFI